MPALPSWLADPLWDQFAALLPPREVFVPTHPWGCHRRRIGDRIVFDKLVQILRFGCSYESIADSTCSASTIRNRRDEWITQGVFAQLKRIALDAYDRRRRAALVPVQGAAMRSMRWFEEVDRNLDADAVRVAWSLFDRRGDQAPWRYQLPLATQVEPLRRARRRITTARRTVRERMRERTVHHGQ